MTMIADGRAITGLSLEQWTRAVVVRDKARRNRVKIPPLTTVSEGEPVAAIVNYGRWLAMCPDPTCGGAEDIWREGPLLFLCLRCGNRAVGGGWLRVLMPEPDERDVIEEMVLSLPRHEQNWQPEEEATSA